MKKIGLLGGTFDPIHYGHLRSALDAKIQLDLDEVHFIPCHIPPHKPGANISHSEDRKTMVELAIADQPSFFLDQRELQKNSPSYTYETVKEIRIENPTAQLYFIMGMDSLLSLHTWHRWQELLNYTHLVVTKRPGSKIKTANQEVSDFLEEHRCANFQSIEKDGALFILETAELEISSTDIRNLISTGKSSHYLLPNVVENFIHEQHLYLHGKTSSNDSN
jgi:nicotinate-nucleotide adenylyltransferase